MAVLASNSLAIFIEILLSIAISISGKEYVVGDDFGWDVNVDYEAWAQGKTFFVGDTLVFNYPEGYHTVVKVNGTGFSQCITSPNSGVLSSGNDIVSFGTAGNKWYICGVGDHCSYYGQKLKLTVMPKNMPGAPEVSPSAAPSYW